MTRKSTKILTKTTKSGIVVILKGNTIIKQYSPKYICMLSFATPEKARKEFSLFRQSHKLL